MIDWVDFRLCLMGQMSASRRDWSLEQLDVVGERRH